MNDLSVIGLGYVGLPTATLFAKAGLKVAGCDVNARIVEALRRGDCPITEPGLPEAVAQVVASGHLRAHAVVEKSAAYLIAVGTPLEEGHAPGLRYLEAAAQAVGEKLGRDELVIVESTVPPGTTRGRVRDILEKASGLVAGKDFHLAHCAERAIPGLALKEMSENDRIVGGIDAASAKAAAALYASFVRGRLIETDATTSEVVKLVENTYRDVNIAFANELARICEDLGADVWRVVELANLHPRVHVHRPGPGVGGHCIPVVPWFLHAAAPDKADLVRLSREINDAQMTHVVGRSLALLRGVERPRVAVLGVAYKAGIDDARETPALPIIRGLEAAGVEVRATDPHVRHFPVPLLALNEAMRGADLVLVLNEEEQYKAIAPEAVAERVRTRLVYDTRRALDRGAWERAGFRVETLGVGVP